MDRPHAPHVHFYSLYRHVGCQQTSLFPLLSSPLFAHSAPSALALLAWTRCINALLPGLAGGQAILANIGPSPLCIQLSTNQPTNQPTVNQTNELPFRPCTFVICMFPVLSLPLTFTGCIISCRHPKHHCKASHTRMATTRPPAS